MLADLVDFKEHSSSIILSDNVEISAVAILKCFIKKSLLLSEVVYLYCFTHAANDFFRGFDVDTQSKVIVHDYSTDSLGWSDDANKFQISCLDMKTDINAVVIIDDLSRVMSLTSCGEVCRFINRFDSDLKGFKLISVLHSDLHDRLTLESLQYCSRAWITLSPVPVESSDIYAISTTVYKKPACSLKKIEENVFIDDKFVLKVSNVVHGNQIKSQKTEDPHTNLTFNVTLKQSEIEARKNLVLPYLAARENTTEKATIDYIPDEFDDFDEEDPDDDLDI